VYSRDHPVAVNMQLKVLKVKLKSALPLTMATQAELAVVMLMIYGHVTQGLVEHCLQLRLRIS